MLPRVLSPTTLENNPALVQTVREIMQQTSLEAVLGDLQGMMERIDSRPFLNQITVPTLILHGMNDQLIPVEEAEAMQAAIPHCQLVLLERAGHLPNLEATEPFNQAVRQFIKNL